MRNSEGNNPTPRKNGEKNPFKGKNLARTPPHRERVNSCPGVLFHQRNVGQIPITNEEEEGVDHLALKATSGNKTGTITCMQTAKPDEDLKRIMERHESTLQKLLDFIGPKSNVHKDIKIMAAQLSSSLKERLQSAEKKLTQEKRMEASTRGTQTMLTNSRVVIQNVAQDNAEQMENLKTPNSK